MPGRETASNSQNQQGPHYERKAVSHTGHLGIFIMGTVWFVCMLKGKICGWWGSKGVGAIKTEDWISSYWVFSPRKGYESLK